MQGTEKRILCDMHTHSQNSPDSACPIAESAAAAIQKNIAFLAVTDHCNILDYLHKNVTLCIENSMREIQLTSKMFEGKIKILKGIELGEGIQNEVQAHDILHRHDYDVVLASVHAVRYKDIHQVYYANIDFSAWTHEKIYAYLDAYFDDVSETLEKIPCDVMAHLTCPLRYINGKYRKNIDTHRLDEKITRILKYIIDHEIAMEINTSGIGLPHGFLLPDEWIIEKYKTLGGRLITLGSDAHVAEKVGNGFDETIRILKSYGFENHYCYQNRKRIAYAL